MSQTIVVGLDLSEGSVSALRHVIALTSEVETEIHVVRCIEEETEETVEDAQRVEQMTAARDEVDQLLKDVTSTPSTISTHVLFSVSPAAELCQLSEKVAADLVVVGAGGAGGSNCAFAVGPVAEGVLRGAGRPVLVFRAPKVATATQD
jgi:nucleotide-binding universal stress UspA family protein